MNEHSGSRTYLLNALEAAPEIFRYSLRDLSEGEADFRPDEARFTLHEVVAHLADWDAIFLQRMQCTRDEDEPISRNSCIFLANVEPKSSRFCMSWKLSIGCALVAIRALEA